MTKHHSHHTELTEALLYGFLILIIPIALLIGLVLLMSSPGTATAETETTQASVDIPGTDALACSATDYGTSIGAPCTGFVDAALCTAVDGDNNPNTPECAWGN